MKIIKLFLAVYFLLLSGCYLRTNSASYQRSLSAHKVAVPKFVGWDQNGYKLEEFHGTVTSRNPSIAKFSTQNDNKAQRPVILNEDGIMCESEDSLANFDRIMQERGKPSKLPASSLISFADIFISFHNLDNSFKKFGRELQGSIDATNTANPSLYGFAASQKAEGLARKAESLASESQNNAEIASSFKKTCKSNSDPQEIEVIEEKPISGYAKISAKINGGRYEVWTYATHLTRM